MLMLYEKLHNFFILLVKKYVILVIGGLKFCRFQFLLNVFDLEDMKT